LNNLFKKASQGFSQNDVAFLDAGYYFVTDTIYIPPNTRIIGEPMAAVIMGVAVAAACGLALWAGWVRVGPSLAWWLAFGVWVLGGALALKVGPGAWHTVPRAARWVLGLAAIWTAWLALSSAKATGINFILSIFCLVWVADIAAYFGGRAFGRRKLALAISPGKSWEGVWSGMVGVQLLALAWIQADRQWAGVDSLSLFSVLLNRLGVPGLVLTLVFSVR
jgi:phosphatidate cytidylyltransferase